jgi:hypothetical protein
MLDVHPPHTSTHTWRGFLIHIATIVVGLIIAVGLEQAVEAIHHHHQRQELREALLEDNQKALRDGVDVERDARNSVQWLTDRMDDVVTALRTHGAPHTIPLIPPSARAYPVDPNWKSAKSSNLVEVLPQEDVKAFSEVDSLIDELVQRLHATEYTSRRVAFEQRFRVSSANDALDFSAATHEELSQYLSLLSEERTNAVDAYSFTLYLHACLTDVIRGERNLDKIDDDEINLEEQAMKHLNDNDPYRTVSPTPTLAGH